MLLLIMLICVILFTVGADGDDDNYFGENDLATNFFEACAEGDYVTIGAALKKDPALASRLNDDGESCAMTAAPPFDHDDYVQHPEPVNVVRTLVRYGADANQRASAERRRAPTIAYHARAFHFRTLAHLLSKGAHVNAEFASATEPGVSVTTLDEYLAAVDEARRNRRDADASLSKDEEFAIRSTREVLLRHGAKRFADAESL